MKTYLIHSLEPYKGLFFEVKVDFDIDSDKEFLDEENRLGKLKHLSVTVNDSPALESSVLEKLLRKLPWGVFDGNTHQAVTSWLKIIVIDTVSTHLTNKYKESA